MQHEGLWRLPGLAQRGLQAYVHRNIVATHKEPAMTHVLDIRDYPVFEGLLRRLEDIVDSLMTPFGEELGRMSPTAFRHLLNARF